MVTDAREAPPREEASRAAAESDHERPDFRTPGRVVPAWPPPPASQPGSISMDAQIPKPGELVAGKLLVERVLGSGGMGVVLAARHVELGERVALEMLRVPSGADGRARDLRTCQDDFSTCKPVKTSRARPTMASLSRVSSAAGT